MVRNTVQRSLVLNAARELANHPTPEEIYDHVKAACPSISRGTVYRNIGGLVDDGLLRRVEIPNAADRVDFNLERHYHLVCTGCGRTFDIKLPFIENLEDMIPDKHGFEISSHDILFRGLCPMCR